MKSSHAILGAAILVLAGFGLYATIEQSQKSEVEKAAEDMGKALDEFADEVDDAGQ